jgi:hypothetical protein
MPNNTQEYAPYFREGMLYLPPRTVELLMDVGLDKQIGHAALRGLNLDDHRQEIALISRILESALENIEEDSQEFRALTDPETQFMLKGKRS